MNGAYYRDMRKMGGMTLTEMAKICGISFSYLHEMEKGNRRFQPDIAATYERHYERRRKAGPDW